MHLQYHGRIISSLKISILPERRAAILLLEAHQGVFLCTRQPSSRFAYRRHTATPRQRKSVTILLQLHAGESGHQVQRLCQHGSVGCRVIVHRAEFLFNHGGRHILNLYDFSFLCVASGSGTTSSAGRGGSMSMPRLCAIPRISMHSMPW